MFIDSFRFKVLLSRYFTTSYLILKYLFFTFSSAITARSRVLMVSFASLTKACASNALVMFSANSTNDATLRIIASSVYQRFGGSCWSHLSLYCTRLIPMILCLEKRKPEIQEEKGKKSRNTSRCSLSYFSSESMISLFSYFLLLER